MTYSINTIFAQVAEPLGRATMTKYMKRFGFYSKPPLDYPPTRSTPAGPSSPQGRPYPPGSPDEDIGRIGIGEGGLTGNPAADGDGGRRRGQRRQADGAAFDQHGRSTRTAARSRQSSPRVYNQVMKPSTAAR